MDALLKSLSIDPKIILLNGILFLVLLQVLDKLFWKPMLKHLDSRKQQISDAYKTVEDTRREMEHLRADYQARLAQIEAEARGRIQATVRDAQKQREELIAAARADSEALMQQGAESIEQEREQALAAMRAGLYKVAATALTRALGAPSNAVQSRLVDEYIRDRVTRQ